jgi:hypothetical protein
VACGPHDTVSFFSTKRRRAHAVGHTLSRPFMVGVSD